MSELFGADPDPLDNEKRKILGKAARCYVPLRDAPDLKRISEILKLLSERLALLGRLKDTPFSVLSAARLEVKVANSRMAGKRQPQKAHRGRTED